ncbi:Ribosomal RNA large subunit methyltransferase H [bioreactor metagenome]|uniref:Ribosomal RNA large subunit methyltransferase H n=1 Tax=bioreactor metagenome TaxID=1076179 RepID=A0A645C115_9ZZZZ
MPLSLITVGKIAKPFAEAASEYEKRLSRYDKVDVIELPDEKEPAHLSPAAIAQVMDKEGRSILGRVRREDAVVALCIEGQAQTSEQLADTLSRLRMDGRRIVFIIGGSLGLSPEVVARADIRLSLSSMTMPHQLARVVLLEQIYRAFKIISGERYHK